MNSNKSDEEFQNAYVEIQNETREKIEKFPKYDLYKNIEINCQKIAMALKISQFDLANELVKALGILTVREINDTEPDYAKLIYNFLGKARDASVKNK